MNTTSLAEVEAFLAVADCQGFGKAARELGIAQSTMSHRVDDPRIRVLLDEILSALGRHAA